VIVRELMTADVITCPPGASLGEVAALLAGHRIHGTFVADGNGRVLGAISDTDVLSGEWLGTDDKNLRVMRGLTAQELMTQPVVTVDAGADIVEAAGRLREARVARLLVTDQGRPVGVLSIADLVAAVSHPAHDGGVVADAMSYGIVVCHADTPLRAAARAMTDRRSRSVAVLDPGSGELVGVLTGRNLLPVIDGRDLDAMVVADVIDAPPLTVVPDTPLSVAADEMLRHEVHRLFVIDPERRRPVPIGLISTADITASMARPGSVWQDRPGG
jgi:CBS domain-containing protein